MDSFVYITFQISWDGLQNSSDKGDYEFTISLGKEHYISKRESRGKAKEAAAIKTLLNTRYCFTKIPAELRESASSSTKKDAKETLQKQVKSNQYGTKNALQSKESPTKNAVQHTESLTKNAVQSAESLTKNVVQSTKSLTNNAVQHTESPKKNAVQHTDSLTKNAVHSTQPLTKNGMQSTTLCTKNDTSSRQYRQLSTTDLTAATCSRLLETLARQNNVRISLFN